MLGLIPWKRNVPQAEEARLPLSAFRRDMDRLFDRFLGEFWGESDGFFGDSVRVEVFENDDEITVRAEVPGIAPEDLNVQLVGDMLVLAGEKKEHHEPSGARTYSERSFGSFRRTLRLNAPVDPRSEERRVGKECRSRWSA